jgi:hypothetical protein
VLCMPWGYNFCTTHGEVECVLTAVCEARLLSMYPLLLQVQQRQVCQAPWLCSRPTSWLHTLSRAWHRAVHKPDAYAPLPQARLSLRLSASALG